MHANGLGRFCGQDEEHDPSEEFEEYLTCAVCGDHCKLFWRAEKAWPPRIVGDREANPATRQPIGSVPGSRMRLARLRVGENTTLCVLESMR